MIFHLAGIQYEDIRFTYDLPRQKWLELKNSGNFEFNQCPMLEITKPDGTTSRYCQTMAICSYLGNKFGLKPTDPEILYRGEVITEHFISDVCKKHFNYPVWYAPEEEKEELYKTVWEDVLPSFLKTLDNTLSKNPNDKFICGNKCTVFDIYVAGYFFNVILNPNSERPEGWKKSMLANSTDRVNKYLDSFKDVFKGYLENRPDAVY